MSVWPSPPPSVDVRNVPVVLAAASTLLVGGQTWLLGYTLQEATGGAPAVVQLIDGGDVTGALVIPISLAAGAQAMARPSLPGYPFERGVFLNVISGSVTGSIQIGKEQ